MWTGVLPHNRLRSGFWGARHWHRKGRRRKQQCTVCSALSRPKGAASPKWRRMEGIEQAQRLATFSGHSGNASGHISGPCTRPQVMQAKCGGRHHSRIASAGGFRKHGYLQVVAEQQSDICLSMSERSSSAARHWLGLCCFIVVRFS